MEDDNGVMVAKMKDKITFKDWLEKMFNDKTNDSIASPSSTSLGKNQWEFYLQEIEFYYKELLSLNLEKDEGRFVEENDDLQISPIEPDVEYYKYGNKTLQNA